MKQDDIYAMLLRIKSAVGDELDMHASELCEGDIEEIAEAASKTVAQHLDDLGLGIPR